VKVLVQGLDPDRWYHYRFRTAPGTSRIGRLRTAPAKGCASRRLRFAFSSCQQINDSHYVAHLAMADEDIDFWVHYGDFVYVHDFAMLTLADHRQVYKRFKANPLLQELHARYPVVAMWDDGEFVNGIDRTLEPARFAAAKQAWFDYQPVMRRRGDLDRTYREITWGDLASFLLLDVRQYRDPWPPGAPGGPPGLSTVDTRTETGAHLFDADRTCLGRRQKSWLKRRRRGPPGWCRPTRTGAGRARGRVPSTGRRASPDQVPSGPSDLESDGSSDSLDSSKEARRPTWGCSTARLRSSPAQDTASAGVTPWSWPSTAPGSWSTTSARRSAARAPPTTPISP
jgi:alkaline phosphatase D